MVVGEFTTETELLVIGAGPGGHAAALRAAELGIETTIVDNRSQLGGQWLHGGCVRSKALVHLVSAIRAATRLRDSGIQFAPPDIDFDQLRAALQTMIDDQAGQLRTSLEKSEIAIVEGEAHFESSRQVAIRNCPATPRIRFRHAVIATGSVPMPFEQAQTDSSRIHTVSDALLLPDLPKSLLVMGGGSSAIEIASIYAALGSKVTLATAADRLLENVDDDLADALTKALRAELEDVALRAQIISMKEIDGGVQVELAGSSKSTSAQFDRVVIAIGRRGGTDTLDLARTKILCDAAGFIEVDAQLRTRDPRIFAVGDVVGEPMLSLKAAQQGRIASEVIAGWNVEFDMRAAPMVIYSDPQLAWTGLNESQARAAQFPYRTRTSLRDTGMLKNASHCESFAKILYDPDTQLILGAGAVGSGAAEIIAHATLAIEMGAIMDDLAAIIPPHPSPLEGLRDAALAEDSCGTS